MIVMDICIDNFLAFRNFHMNMSYPKKILDSKIEHEHLDGRPNFRYKKVNILMGTNATGKTSFGHVLMSIFNFMDKKQFESITQYVCDTEEKATFTMDFITEGYTMYRIDTVVSPKTEDKYKSSDIKVGLKKTDINSRDSYETCRRRLDSMEIDMEGNYIEKLEEISNLSWNFDYPSEPLNQYILSSTNVERYIKILENTLRVLDPSIVAVEKIQNIDNAFVARTQNNRSVIIQDGKVLPTELLSSGTLNGIAIAGFVNAIIDGIYSFYYCDEKFSYIQSDIEKAFLSIMIECLKPNDQLFFTTHNKDILDLPLPKHSFIFLKKDCTDEQQPIRCVCAADFLKRSADSLRNAVDNDLFSAAPDLEKIYQIVEFTNEETVQ